MRHHYCFVSRWKFDAPLEVIWVAIYDSERWPEWWPYVKLVYELQKGDECGIGSIREYLFSSPLGYKLRFRLQLEDRKDLQLLKGIVSGDLNGTGCWKFYRNGNYSVAECHWKVCTRLPWMNLFSLVLAPVFRLNHSLVMRAGERALRQRIEQANTFQSLKADTQTEEF